MAYLENWLIAAVVAVIMASTVIAIDGWEDVGWAFLTVLVILAFWSVFDFIAWLHRIGGK